MGLIPPKLKSSLEDKVERVSLDKKGYLRDEKGNVVVTDKVFLYSIK
jgi:hypothetical protein